MAHIPGNGVDIIIVQQKNKVNIPLSHESRVDLQDKKNTYQSLSRHGMIATTLTQVLGRVRLVGIGV